MKGIPGRGGIMQGNTPTVKSGQRKGFGSVNHLPAGHVKHVRGVFKKFPGGNGCQRHDNCLTCPLDDCKWGSSPNDK